MHTAHKMTVRMRVCHARITRSTSTSPSNVGWASVLDPGLCSCRRVMTDLSKELWYHGRMSRVDAEKILDNSGGAEGTYLVRDSLTITGEYVLSLCHQVCPHPQSLRLHH